MATKVQRKRPQHVQAGQGETNGEDKVAPDPESVQKVSFFVPKKKYNYLTGWFETKDPKDKPGEVKIAKTVRINGKPIVQI